VSDDATGQPVEGATVKIFLQEQDPASSHASGSWDEKVPGQDSHKPSQAQTSSAATPLFGDYQWSRRSTRDGKISFCSLRPGLYDIRVERPGFKAGEMRGVEIEEHQTTYVGLGLEAGDASEMTLIPVNGGIDRVHVVSIPCGTPKKRQNTE